MAETIRATYSNNIDVKSLRLLSITTLAVIATVLAAASVVRKEGLLRTA